LPQFAELVFSPILAGKSGGVFKLGDEGIERAVLMVRRAEVAQARMRLGSDLLGERRSQPRFPDPRLARDQHDPAFTSFRLLPAAQ